MSVKSELRKLLKIKRHSITDKTYKDDTICNRLLHSEWYKKADTVLCYAALDDEINMDRVITQALSDHKKVALPVCIDDMGHMEFYYINSLEDIKVASFSVREPDATESIKVNDFTNSICIVPAIAYDVSGFRLGYGKGYYDRFLSNYISLSIGLCYNELLVDKLPADEFDLPVNSIITQNGIILM